MKLTPKEWLTFIHGMLLGSVYLLAFAGGLVDLLSLKSAELTDKGAQHHLKRLRIGMWVMTVISWLTVATGIFVIYPWYHAGVRNFLLDNPDLSRWETFGMEWKVHIGLLAPLLMTCVAFIVTYYKVKIIQKPVVRNTLIALFLLSFFTAGIAAVFGTFITKLAPVSLGDYLWNAKNLISK